MRGIPSLKRAWSSSTLVRVGVVLGLVSLLALAVIVVATVFADRSTGKAAAINVAGSLRMQSFALATRIAAAPGSAAGRGAVAEAVAQFEQRLAHPALVQSVAAGGAELRTDYEAVAAAWRATMRPLAEAAPDQAGARAEFLRRVDGFVQQIDTFVHLIERDLESRIQRLQIALGVGFFVLVLLVASILLLLNIEVFHPVARLVEAARRVQAGDFSVRAYATGADEIGQLGQSFNMMVQELGHLTADLERQVQQRTHDLERRNRSLALLYETTRTLSAGPVDRTALARVLEIVHQLLQIEAGVLCPARRLAGAAEPLAQVGTLPLEQIVPREEHDMAPTRLSMRVDAGPTGERRLVSVPLIDAGALYGHMHLALPPGRALEQWQLELTETIGRHIGAALANAERREEHRRLGVLEERGAMARELHDSIAQALAYTQIQVTRLSATLRSEGHGAASQRVLEELRNGLGNAYRQLRELLATFRLQLGGQGLGQTLRETVADFERRSGVATQLDDRIGDVELGINAQVHVLQIVREALSNVEHHAHARHAVVRLRELAGGHLEVTVEDDGIGIATQESPRGHFGLAIMRDRAQLLDGEFAVSRRVPPAAGTCVRLTFPSARGSVSPAPVDDASLVVS